MTQLEEKAKAFATNAHKGQTRKYTGDEYITHPAAVVEIVRSITHTDAMLVAAWLHDVVEDCGVSIDTIDHEFGIVVGELVSDLTDVSKPSDGNRAKRKAIDLKHTAQASANAKTIKCADLIHNTESITKYDPDFAIVYRKEKQRLLEVLREADSTLWNRAAELAGVGESNA